MTGVVAYQPSDVQKSAGKVFHNQFTHFPCHHCCSHKFLKKTCFFFLFTVMTATVKHTTSLIHRCDEVSPLINTNLLQTRCHISHPRQRVMGYSTYSVFFPVYFALQCLHGKVSTRLFVMTGRTLTVYHCDTVQHSLS